MNGQHLQALAVANETSVRHAGVRRELRTREITLCEALSDDRAQSMTVYDVLCAQHRWGPGRTRRTIRLAGLKNERKRVRDLTDRQISALLLAAESGVRDTWSS